MKRIKGMFTDQDRLVFILVADALASLIELENSGKYGSSMLLGSAGLGLIEALLFAANVFGQGQEEKQVGRVGFWVAKVSDVALGTYFVFLASYYITTLDQMSHLVQGLGIIITGFLVGLIQAACLWICPTDSENGKSAYMKLVIAAITNIIMSLVVGLGVWFGFWWLDRAATIILPVLSVTYIVVSLRHRHNGLTIMDIDKDGQSPGT
jgi:hypothetical protein